MRLFRQAKVGDWGSVVERVGEAIGELHRDRAFVRSLNRRVAAAKAEYEPDVASLMRRVLRPGDTFVDVGANVGRHTVLAAALVGHGGEVIAIEPGENALPALRSATEKLPQVTIVERPAWNEADEALTFHLCADDSGGNAAWDPGEFATNTHSRANPQARVLETVTLDRIVSAKTPRLIKIDVEGAEQRVLEGASDLLSGPARPPFIIAELHEFGLAKLGCSQASLRALMASRGYSTFFIFADGSLPQLVPDQTAIKSQLIFNILFSTPAAVGEAWADKPVVFPALRPMLAYGVPAEAAA